MKLQSGVFDHGQSLPAKYTCDGDPPAGGSSPPLLISSVPPAAKSLALIMDDPDAVKPAGRVWDHWLVWNIPPTIGETIEGKEPPGVVGAGTGGQRGYQGPCPPDGEHRYFFKLYALDRELVLPSDSTKEAVEAAMAGHILAVAELMGRYARQKDSSG